MATFLRTKIQKSIGTSAVTLLSPTGITRYTVIGCNVANVTDDDVFIDVTMVDPSLNEVYFIKQLKISPYNSAKLVTNGEKLVIAENCLFKIVSDTTSSVDVIISYAEIV
jgi:hypothetical protein